MSDQRDPVAVLREATETFSGIKMGDTGRVVLSRADVDAALVELESRQAAEARLERWLSRHRKGFLFRSDYRFYLFCTDRDYREGTYSGGGATLSAALDAAGAEP